MNQLILMLVFGAVLLVLFLLALLRGAPKPEEAPAAYGRITKVMSLPGLSFASPERLFDPADYHALRNLGIPSPATDAVVRERRRLALLWLRLMRDDVRTLWRFHRMLAVQGVNAGLTGELRTALVGVTAVAMIHVLRFAVAVAGPFSVAHSCQMCRARVESIWRGAAALFGQVPASQVAEFERRWLASTAATPVSFSH